MSIKVGDKLPDATFMEMTADGPAPCTTADVFGGKTVALSSRKLPRALCRSAWPRLGVPGERAYVNPIVVELWWAFDGPVALQLHGGGAPVRNGVPDRVLWATWHPVGRIRRAGALWERAGDLQPGIARHLFATATAGHLAPGLPVDEDAAN